MKSAAAVGLALLAATRCTVVDAPRDPAPRLAIRAPDLEHPVSEADPPPSRPEDPVKKAVFERINADRTAAGLLPVAWDAAASRVADEFTAAQVREGTRGHFLLDGLPPYARTALAGIFGLGAENSVAWNTTGSSFHESPVDLGLEGESAMLGEKPPNDGHRRTILDPDATHVGVGWAQGGGRFRMAEEFLTRRLAELTVERVATVPVTVLFRGRPVAGQHLQFVTLAREPSPRKLTRAEVNARARYTYPEPHLAYVAEGLKSMRVVGATTEDRVRMAPGGDFSFRFTPPQAGLWTIVFHFSDGRTPPKSGGVAVLWVEPAAAR
ncbi:MAG: CAP domain-containing protein [Syntrophomonadaceae bacterium]